MTKLNEIYWCKICGNSVKVMNAGNGTLMLWTTNGISKSMIRPQNYLSHNS